MVIDWIEGTFKGKTVSESLELVRDYLKASDWQALKYGGHGYTHSAIVFHFGRVFWSPDRPEMGVHVSLPPSALDKMGRDRAQVLLDLTVLGMDGTRIDTAGDDLSGWLDLAEIGRSIREGEFTSDWYTWEHLEDSDGGQSWKLGKRDSNSQIIIYDKAAEQFAKTGQRIVHWVRVEHRHYKERARAFQAALVLNFNRWQEFAAGLMYKALDFKQRGTDTNKCRWSTVGWWTAFLAGVSKVRLHVSKVVPTVESIREWVDKQVSSSLYILLQTVGLNEIMQMAGKAAGRLRPEQMEMIKMWEEVYG